MRLIAVYGVRAAYRQTLGITVVESILVRAHAMILEAACCVYISLYLWLGYRFAWTVIST